jgi:hypothetical protein
VKRYILAITAAMLTAPGTSSAQLLEDDVLTAYDRIASSVVRIRTVADLAANDPQPSPSRPYSVDGTGVVIGTMEVGGRTEYLILTNHHVADASVYVMEDDGYIRINLRNTMAIPRVPEESFLVEDEGDSFSASDIELVKLLRWVTGDMTLMRTAGATHELTVFDGRIGYPEDHVRPGDPIITSGFPYGREELTSLGEILEIDHRHDLGVPHDDFVIDIQVVPGQSGSPIFLIEEGEEGDPEFRLIGLVHARDGERNYAVKYRSWIDVLESFPEELHERMEP